jgi:hypothetical protein
MMGVDDNGPGAKNQRRGFKPTRLGESERRQHVAVGGDNGRTSSVTGLGGGLKEEMNSSDQVRDDDE